MAWLCEVFQDGLQGSWSLLSLASGEAYSKWETGWRVKSGSPMRTFSLHHVICSTGHSPTHLLILAAVPPFGLCSSRLSCAIASDSTVDLLLFPRPQLWISALYITIFSVYHMSEWPILCLDQDFSYHHEFLDNIMTIQNYCVYRFRFYCVSFHWNADCVRTGTFPIFCWRRTALIVN